MKLILRQYLSGLRERDELDAILPDLLSELGFNVLSTPSRGTRQAGVDVAAVGPDEDDGGRQKLFLFTIKSGDLRRSDWDDGSPQAVRQSLNEICDSYILHRISEEHRSLDIVVCVCMGGEMKEGVREQWVGYVQENSRDGVSFREWNGDKLAGFLLLGVLKEEILDSHLQAYFRKSIAMIDHPDVSYRFFTHLVQGLLKDGESENNRITKLRQIYLCLWVLFVWAREEGNLQAPFQASEYAVLSIWNECRLVLDGDETQRDIRFAILDQAIKLHQVIAHELLIEKLGGFVGKPYALSVAVSGHSSVDVNLALFEQFGRLCLYGFWQHWWAHYSTDTDTIESCLSLRDQAFRKAIEIINSNPALKSPLRDDFMIEIALFMMLAQACGAVDVAAGYLEEASRRIQNSIKFRTAYPVPMTDYHDLLDHPKDKSDEYFEESTCGSVLYPLLVAWLDKLDMRDTRDLLTRCIREVLPHTTQQVWVPDEGTDEKIWIGDTDHGVAIPGLPLCEEPQKYAAILEKIFTDHVAFNDLSTMKCRLWPIFLMACRHFRLPVPPQLWFFGIARQDSDEETDNSGQVASV